MARLTYRPIRVQTGSVSEDGVLALLDEQLIAVLVRLDSPQYGAEQGQWHFEAGFGQFDARPDVFESLVAVTVWIADRLGVRAEELDGIGDASAGGTC